jgi:hypothetical protein
MLKDPTQKKRQATNWEGSTRKSHTQPASTVHKDLAYSTIKNLMLQLENEQKKGKT